MYLIKNEKFVNGIDDLQGIVDEEIFQAIESIALNEDDRVESIKEEMDVYSDENNQLRNGLFNISKKLEKLLEDIEDAKRLNRNKITENIKDMIEDLDAMEL